MGYPMNLPSTIHRTVILAVLLPTALAASTALAAEKGFAVSYVAGERDAAGQFMGGTELRNLTTHQGRLYAGNGYWEDRPGSEGVQGPQVLVLEKPGGPWRVEHSFDEKQPNGRRRHLAVSALLGVTFATDGEGKKLSHGISMLLAGTWDLSGGSEVFGRDDAMGHWTSLPLPVERVTTGIQQVRALAFHTDRKTDADLVFVGNSPHGILRGSSDAAAPGGMRWEPKPELDLAQISAPAAPGLTNPRVSSFAE